MTLSASEAKRKTVHILVGGFAFLLRFLTWRQALAMAAAAFIFNWQVLPRIGGKGLWRHNEHADGYAHGILMYPFAVFALIFVFRGEAWKAAAVWGVLALGDGMASIAGQALEGPRLPWNPRKGWIGFFAFVVFGAAGAAVLIAWTLKAPLGGALSAQVLGIALPLAIVCALVETVPTTLDDNLTVPLVGGLYVALVAPVPLTALVSAPGFVAHLVVGVVVNGGLAAAAYAARSIDLWGGVSALVIGTAITIGLGLPGLAVMIAFFVVGSAVTKLGYRVKAERGIAQAKGGARGWRNAWANGGVPALLALLAGARAAGFDAPEAALIFIVAYAASVATAAADTCSSEVGKAYGRRTFLITTLKPVPPGTEGAISLEGTLGGLLGAAIVAAVGALGGLYAWTLVPVVATAGLLGSLAESVLGTVAERRGWLDNDLLNAVNTAIGAAIAVLLVRAATWAIIAVPR